MSHFIVLFKCYYSLFINIANPFMLAKIMICCYLNAKIYFFNPWETIVGSRQLAIQHHQVKFQNPVSWLSSIHFLPHHIPVCVLQQFKFGVFDGQTRRIWWPNSACLLGEYAVFAAPWGTERFPVAAIRGHGRNSSTSLPKCSSSRIMLDEMLS